LFNVLDRLRGLSECWTGLKICPYEEANGNEREGRKDGTLEWTRAEGDVYYSYLLAGEECSRY